MLVRSGPVCNGVLTRQQESIASSFAWRFCIQRNRLARPVVDQTNKTQMTRALLALREQILSGEFKPGDRMAELPLVERLGVSRTPLRLALASLEHEGLLRTLPAGGYVVREFTRADIRDAIEIRGVLEGTAARFRSEEHTSE